MSDHYAYYNQNQITDRKINKVYINPNFNRSDTATNYSLNNMYLNPNFSHNATNSINPNSVQDPIIQKSKARIHVNPNFLRNPNISKPVVSNNPIKTITMPTSINNSVLLKEEQNQSQNPVTSVHVTRSRYCLVRQKENVITKSPASKPITTTVRVNKYKSVSLHVIKNNLETVKLTNTISASSSSLRNEKNQSCKQIAASNKYSRFKFVKPNTANVLNQSQAKHVAARSYSYNVKKSVVKTPSRKINNRLVLKKNNIPCPLFKKYGKCLRKIRGTCEYLHDIKHVSICRKFLKGVCHDKDCLLSHDLTDKKMPTCYFYLQGACTKESCPYLHVKLNEKTKICKEFLTGYCENGDKCLFRHINVCGNMTSRARSSDSKINVVKVKSRKKLQVQRQENNPNKKVNDHHTEAHRYFKEAVEDTQSGEKCNMIKPSRIKLGILPAFIQL